MGLDSVELLMQIEKYFGITIPDAEAEKIYTVQSMVDSVAKHLDISNEDKVLRDIVFDKIVTTIQASGFTDQKVELNSLISSFIPTGDTSNWIVFSESLGLSVPKPELARPFGTRISEKLKKSLGWSPNYEWEAITCEQFVDAICANNYAYLIDRNEIKSKYEIYVVVAGITVDKTGVDYYEVAPGKSFTADLGVD